MRSSNGLPKDSKSNKGALRECQRAKEQIRAWLMWELWYASVSDSLNLFKKETHST